MTVRVFLHHYGVRREVGLLADTAHGLLFEYHPDFLATGIPLSPYMLPLRPGTFRDDKLTFDGLFGVFNDSLPDGWGLLLLDRALARQKRSLADCSPLERLTLAGSRSFGALEYEPDASSLVEGVACDFDKLAEESLRLLEEQSCQTEALDTLINLSGSLGGARPKVLLEPEDEHGEPQSWIVKFRAPGDSPEAGLQEYRLSLAARRAGLDMPETRLFASAKGPGYFGVRRFDRVNGQKIHAHTACGLLHASHRFPSMDYENLIRLTASLTRSSREVERMVALMVFNVLAGNRDDHTRNFAFLMDEHFHWHLAPAYDLTRCVGFNGEHCSTVNGKGRDITDRDLIQAAAVGGLAARTVQHLIERTRDALADEFRD